MHLISYLTIRYTTRTVVHKLTLKQFRQPKPVLAMETLKINLVFPLKSVIRNVLIKSGGIEPHSHRITKQIPFIPQNTGGICSIKPLYDCRMLLMEQQPERLKNSLFRR
jgi:hypothetical protein